MKIPEQGSPTLLRAPEERAIPPVKSLAVYALLILVIVAALAVIVHRAHVRDTEGDTSDSASQEQDLANAVVKSVDGSTAIKIKSYRGKWLLLNVWATWCGPCNAEMPDLEKLWEHEHPAGLQMLGVSAEEPLKIYSFLLNNPNGSLIKYPIAQDAGGLVSSALQVTGIPRTVILDPKGHIVFDTTGEAELPDVMEALKAAGFPVR